VLVALFQLEEYHFACSPVMLIEKEKGKDKKVSKTKRTVRDYRRLNQRIQPHALYIVVLEQTIENLCARRFKSKLDMRSGFWQVDLSPRAQTLTSFVVPSGRCYRWKVMPFGLSQAPGVFQELMMRLLDTLAQVSAVQEIYSRGGTVQAFFDDVGVGTDTLEDHRELLKHLFQACEKLSLRIKLTKCEFAVEEMEYLGFELQHNRWRPSQSKVDALQKVKIKNLKDLRSFLGALNFFRRHIENFTYSSCILSDLTKKDVPWRWGDLEEEAVEELKQKVKNSIPLGVPRAKGKIVMITDASDIGGGAVAMANVCPYFLLFIFSRP
jgi:hypothetical protein